MITGPGLGIILAAALTYFAVTGIVHGVKKLAHGVGHAVHRVIHPHEKEAPK